MKFLQSILQNLESYTELRQAVKIGSLPAAISGLGEIHKANFAASLSAELGCTVVIIAADEAECARMCSDLEAMGRRVCRYPVRDLSFHPLEGRSREFEQQRIETLCKLLAGECDAVVTTADAAMQMTLPPDQLRERMVMLRAGGQTDPQQCARSLISAGYERCDVVEGPGQFSVRGGIIDLYPPDAPAPVRAELWGDEIDTLSYFDTQTQRRTDPIDSVAVFPAAELTVDDPEALAQRLTDLAKSLRGKQATARERLMSEAESIRGGLRPACADKYLPLLCRKEATVLDYLAPDAIVIVSEYASAKERAKSSEARQNEEIKCLIEDGVLCKGLTRYSLTCSELFGKLSEKAIFMDTFARSSIDAPLKHLMTVTAHQMPAWDGQIAQIAEDVRALLDRGLAVAVLGGSAKAADVLWGDLEDAGLPADRAASPQSLTPGRVTVTDGGLSAGMEYPEAGVAVLTWGRGLTAPARKITHRRKKGTEIQSLSELSPGDYVVHVTHGIGYFGGIVKINTEGLLKDYIKITYDRGDVLYVPVTQLDLVSKYIGSKEDGAVRLSRLGSGDWAAKKQRVRRAVKDIAKELIRLYSARMQAQGYPFEPDGEWQRDFEARFEYNETEDQERCISEIKGDMERPVPMDRLLCGDVGFGKTEVALRAAFKCVCEGKQCAMLAPTTILAWQHYQTALRRFEGLPARVELLSRFRTPKQRADIIKALERGEVDFIIGTHSLLQKSVKFRDLGLAIIDEEQRFGVAHKERFKEAFHSVDVLTLSATPIPRTLNMALSGLRDISVLEEAPHNRHPVQTYVMEYDRAVIADAIRRELRRGGQVYYLYNRVGSIESAAARIHEMVPDAAIGYAHGQMSENEISREWKRMLDHEIDVLVCTTIIESGVDIPNANTLIVENADRFGLSQLHQLRGRVGRSSRRAYAYLTFSRGRELTEIASKRLSAIREFTEFGSGMKIAMRDLELRGAGNVLGGEQSGHLEMVGYDLYLKLLNEAVSQEKGEKPAAVDAECTVDLQIEAHIPESYIESLTLRLDVYRMIADIRSDDDASDVVDELIDRFGEPPAAVMGLVRVAQLRNRAASLGVTEVKQVGGNLVLYLSRVDAQRISALCAALPGRVMLSAGSKPYITVKTAKNTSALDQLSAVLEAM